MDNKLPTKLSIDFDQKFIFMSLKFDFQSMNKYQLNFVIFSLNDVLINMF